MKAIKSLIAYHDKCIDGFTSAYIAYKYILTYRQEVPETIAVSYTQASEALLGAALAKEEYLNLYVVDFSLSLEFLEYLNKTYPILQIFILDHHKSALEKYLPHTDLRTLEPEKLLCFDLEQFNNVKLICSLYMSGAHIVHNYFYGHRDVPNIVMLVEDYDLWKFQYGDKTKQIHQLLMAADKSFEEWERLTNLLQNPEEADKLFKQGKKLLESFTDKVAEYVSNASVITLWRGNDYYDVPAVACPPEFASAVGNELAKTTEFFGVTFSLVSEKGHHLIKWSLRSVGDFDVAKLASYFEGGGHKNAAGFTTLFEGGMNNAFLGSK